MPVFQWKHDWFSACSDDDFCIVLADSRHSPSPSKEDYVITSVVVTEKLSSEGMNILEKRGFKVSLPERNDQSAFEKLLPEAEAIVLRTNVQINAACFDKAPKLKIIARTGAGYDNVDVKTASKHGVLVCNLVGVNSESVAEHAIALIVALGKQLPYYDRAVRSGDWQARRSKASIELEGKTLGVAAMGNVGAKVAQMAHDAFSMRILAYDPYVKDRFADYDYRFVDDLKDLFRESDFVTLHLPSVPETKGIVNRDLLALMKPGAYLINTARGDLVVEADLVETLRSKNLGGAALDVFEEEPPAPDNPLFGLDNVILTPHVASLTKEVTAKAAVGAAQAVVDYADGKIPRFVVNRESIEGSGPLPRPR
jgi:D-3-phosphoglycerate dehydrogenase